MGLPDNLSSLKADQLRDECEARGIVSKGISKDEMRAAIVEFEKHEAGQSDKAGENSTDDYQGISGHSEIQMLKMKLEHEFRIRQLEREEREHERELERDERERERVFQTRHSNDSSVSKCPKLPTFQEGEDVEVYLGTFERIAQANKWNTNTWAPRLAALLTGKAREAYVRMDLSDSGDYQLLCTAIRDRYDLTPDTYRRKFRSSRKQFDETFKEWGIRARKLFERWMGSSIGNAKKICEILIMEQIIENTTPELQLWLREHEPKSVDELTNLADVYRTSRQSYIRSNKSENKDRFSKRNKYSPDTFNKPVSSTPMKPRFEKVDTDSKSSADRLRYITCFKCKEKGHYQSECPNKPVVKSAGFCRSPTRMAKSFDKYSFHGEVEGTPVTMLMDSGSNCTLVHGKFVSTNVLPGKSMEMLLADGSIRNVPVAVVTLTGSLGSVTQEVGVVKSLPCDVLLGHDTKHIVDSADSSGGVRSGGVNSVGVRSGGVNSGGVSSGGDSSGGVSFGGDSSCGENAVDNVGSNHVGGDNIGVDNHEGYIPGDKSGSCYSEGVKFIDNTACNYLVRGENSNAGANPSGCTLTVTRAQAKQQHEKQTTENNLISRSDVNAKSLFNPEENHNVVTQSNVLDLDVVDDSVQSHSKVDALADTNDSSYIGVQFSDNDSDSLSGDANNVHVSDPIGVDITREQLIALQQSDPSLEHVRSVLRNEPPSTETGYFLHNGIMTRRYFSSSEVKPYVDQVVIPRACRSKFLELAHDIPLSGHLGQDKTRNRLLAHYFWPGIYSDVRHYCTTCPNCQLTSRKCKSDRAKLIPVPVMDIPFRKIGIDIVGPLPRSERGKKYILTIVDYATRYPEAFPLSSQTAENVADCLFSLFSRVGIPDEIVSDQGTNFMSELITQLCTTLSIKRIKSSIYHPEANGLVERFNATMKHMIKKFVHDEPKLWDQMLPFILFAYREVPEASTGFSPFELVYGWPVRGPLSVVKEQWLNDSDDESLVEYVLKIRKRLSEVVGEAHKHLGEAQTKMKAWYDKSARNKVYEAGEEVLVLLPSSARCLEAQWQGPFKVIRKVSSVDYEVDTGKSRTKLKIFHVNLLKKWRSRTEIALLASTVFNDCDEIVTCSDEQTESWIDVGVSLEITATERKAINDMLQSYSDVFSDVPSITNSAVHHIETVHAVPVRQKPYRIPHAYKESFQNEIQQMLRQGIIKRSNSEWASPVVLVPKMHDGKQTGLRVCVDYRKLNSVTRFDPYPLPRMEDLIENLGEAKFISKLDLTKGYWQTPLTTESQEKTAFITPTGLYEFLVMPFGLMNAPATFQRMIQKVFSGTEDFAGAYLDDVVIHSKTFQDHIEHVGRVLECLRNSKLVAKPSKCEIGHAEVNYLGHMVGSGVLRPLRSKIESVEHFPRPETKKQLRGFLGLLGYYRKFIPNFSEVAATLSDRTGKKFPNKLRWSAECEKAFNLLKIALITRPVLKLPNFDKPFIVQVDASERGLGAVLCQKDEQGREHPVVYASRKLLERERSLSTTEKECLSLVWAIQLLHPYLYGTTFVVETDHNALVWLYKVKDTNQKLLRWSLILQQYKFSVCHKRGKDNVNADVLSRI